MLGVLKAIRKQTAKEPGDTIEDVLRETKKQEPSKCPLILKR